MATVARMSRRLLPRTLTSTLVRRAFSAEAAQLAHDPAPIIRESPDRVKWDYRGQRNLIPLGQWAPTSSWPAKSWSGTALPSGTAPLCTATSTRFLLASVPMCRSAVLYTPLGLLLQKFRKSIMTYISVDFPDKDNHQDGLDFAQTEKYFTMHLLAHDAQGSEWLTYALLPFRLPQSLIYLSISAAHCLWFTEWLPAETLIERFVTIGTYSLLCSCTIEPECIIGQHSVLMEGSLVETHSILEAGSVVPPGRRIPSGELWAGNPAKFVRALTHEETLEIPELAVAINDLSRSYCSEFLPYSTVYLEVEKLKKSLGISI
ncbi:hypothetical protein SASPL_154836 [Salvia splendens]|uniref:Gamma carbonic anhydrase n=1 Tax=Salvia splendens TaxID=180675 RepID=A0A8X8W0T2_SALSN|nr:hypothetical protein SASPL_154836 [Salvia splendens]